MALFHQPRWKCTKKQKMITLEVKFESNINGIREKITDHGKADTAAVPVILDVQPD